MQADKVFKALGDPTRRKLLDLLCEKNGQTLGQFLTTFLAQPANTNVTTIVTGHSLGGCLATIVATWMRVLLPKYRDGDAQRVLRERDTPLVTTVSPVAPAAAAASRR